MIRQAIDSYAANLDAQARPATVDRLTSINPPVTQLEFVFADSMKTIQIGYDGKPGTTVVLGATGIPTNGAQDEILLFKVGTQEGCLVETYYADDGTRTNRYSLSPDGMSMAMEVTVESPYMPASLVYRVGFARKGGTRAIPRKAIAPVSNTCQFPAFANLFPSSLACRLTRNVNGRSSF